MDLFTLLLKNKQLFLENDYYFLKAINYIMITTLVGIGVAFVLFEIYMFYKIITLGKNADYDVLVNITDDENKE